MVGVPDTLNIPKCVQTLRGNHIQCNVQSCFINDRINLVGNKCLACKLHADIAANLAHPHIFPIQGDGRQPEPKMVACIYGVARLLQGKVLRSTE